MGRDYLIVRRMWPGHWMVVLIVNRWRRPYYWFNRLFARASLPVELSICDRALWDRWQSGVWDSVRRLG